MMMRSPWLFVSTLYFAAGVPYIVVNSVSIILYKQLGVTNEQISFWTSWLYLPWVIKMFWGPVVDVYSTKRNWILYTQLALVGGLSSLSLTLHLPHFFGLSLLVLAIAACISATQDIAIDGFYLLALNEESQAFFVGIRSTAYRIAAIFSSGLLVFLVGQLESTQSIAFAWTVVLNFAAFIFAGLAIFHYFILPFPDVDIPHSFNSSLQNFYKEVIKTYLQQERIWVVLAFILLYRLGEAMLIKLAAPFLLDSVAVGGLGLSISQVGLAYGTVGALALTLGGILGGWLVARFGLKRTLTPMAVALNLPHLFYVYMAYTQPVTAWVYPLVAIEQFGYGLGTAAYSVYLMYLAQSSYKTSHFAISTAVMALGMMLPGLVSGYIQQALGYPLFFVVVFLLAIPGMLTLFFIPLNKDSAELETKAQLSEQLES